MKILTGELKGRALLRVASPSLRPTSDKVRMALANALRARLAGAKVLDLFCGTGGVGMEFLSNGAERAVFFDSAVSHLTAARKSAEGLQISARCSFVRGEFPAALSSCVRYGPFDLIFADPPYDSVSPADLLQKIRDLNLLVPAGVVIIEVRKRASARSTAAGSGFKFLDQRRYGDSELIWFGVTS